MEREKFSIPGVGGIIERKIDNISDNADEGATISYEEFESKAAYNSAKVVLRMLDKM